MSKMSSAREGDQLQQKIIGPRRPPTFSGGRPDGIIDPVGMLERGSK
jgi:hypothetical protein